MRVRSGAREESGTSDHIYTFKGTFDLLRFSHVEFSRSGGLCNSNRTSSFFMSNPYLFILVSFSFVKYYTATRLRVHQKQKLLFVIAKEGTFKTLINFEFQSSN